MSDAKCILVSFGRSDPLRLTEATHDMLGDSDDIDYIWGPDFARPCPEWGSSDAGPLYDWCLTHDVVYCGHGATLLEATAAGCEVMVLAEVDPKLDNPNRAWLGVKFIPAWTGLHLDHSGLPVRWWEPGSMADMAREIRERRK